MIQKIYNGYVREIILYVYKGGVDLQNIKKFKLKIFKKLNTNLLFEFFQKAKHKSAF